MALKKYPLGSSVALDAHFTREDTDAAYDPTTVNLWILKPDGTEDETPGLSPLTVGHYHADLVVDQSGEWKYRFEGVGGLAAAKSGAFTVESKY